MTQKRVRQLRGTTSPPPAAAKAIKKALAGNSY